MQAVDIATRTALGLLCLVSIAVVVLAVARVPQWWVPASALARAAGQLAVLSFLLTGIIADPLWIALALAVMFVAAVVVSARRSGWSVRHCGRTAVALGLGAVVSISVVFASGALEPSPRYALAVSAIVIGGAMTTATLTGRRYAQARSARWSEVEAWLALGATVRQANLDLGRGAVREALIPMADQTKTTGLVVLPGAFVGAIFGGLSPLEAGRFQLIVLAALLAAGAVTAVTTVWLAGADGSRPPSPP